MKSEKLKYYTAYTLLFSAISLIVYSWFFLNGKTFVDYGDGVHLEYITLVYFGRYVRQVIHDLIITGSLNIPMFDFSIGYGSDALISIILGGIGDPLNLLYIFVPESITDILFSFLAIFRVYLSGIAFSLYCRYMKKPRFATLCGALIYTFCGFSLIMAVRHPFFITPMIYLPLLLIGIEQIYAKKKPYLFIIMVFVATTSFFYFFYKLTILLVIYATIRFFAICRNNRVKNLFKWLGRFSLYYATGLLMACTIFLPIVLNALSTTRASVDNAVDVFYPLGYYIRFASSFITPSAREYSNMMGYSPVALIATILLFTKKKDNIQVKIGFLLLTLFLFIPVAGYAFNGFLYVSNRWVFGYSFIVAIITVAMMQDILKLTKKQLIIVTAFMTLYFLQGLVYSLYTKEFIAATLIAFILIVFMFINYVVESKKSKGEQLKETTTGATNNVLSKTIIISLIILGISVQAYYLYAPSQGNFVVKYTSQGEALRLQTDNSSYVIKQLGDDSFFRFEANRFSGQSMTRNSSLLNSQNSIDSYYNLSNPYVSRFLFFDVNIYDFADFSFRGLESRAMPGALASVKYFVVKPGLERYIPYGYYDRVLSTDKYDVYQNNYYLPIGYAYDNIIPETTYRNLSAIEKQQALLQVAVIHNYIIQENENEPEFNHAVVPYEMVLHGDISYEDGVFTVEDYGASVTLLFEGLRDSETYLSINNLHFSKKNLRDNISADEWVNLSLFERMRVNINNLLEPIVDSAIVEFSSGDISRSIICWTPHFDWYFGQHDYLIHFFYDINEKTEIEITFKETGVYNFDSIEVICQPMDNFSTQIDRLRKVVMENVTIDTNRVTGTINSDKEKLLVFSIPYSKNWRAYLNGEEVELFNANAMYCGIYVPAGTHEITLKYMTPYLIHGIILSLTGILIFAGIIVYHYKADKRNKV